MILERMPHLAQRMLFGSIGLAVVLIAIFLSRDPSTAPILVVVTSAIIGLALREYYKIAKIKGFQAQSTLGITSSLLYIIAIFITATLLDTEELPVAILGLSFLAVFIFYIFWGSNPFVNLAITTFGIVYLTIPLSCMIRINYFFPTGDLQDGRWWIIYLLAITFITDSGAYFFGKTLGRNKLAPIISPKKTWEGALGGYSVAVAVSILFASIEQIPIHMSLWDSVLIGTILSLLAQIGDLAESLLKRDVGVKDSSRIPGLGGMLDVVDSLVFTAPALYFFLRMQ